MHTTCKPQEQFRNRHLYTISGHNFSFLYVGTWLTLPTVVWWSANYDPFLQRVKIGPLVEGYIIIDLKFSTMEINQTTTGRGGGGGDY